eukprot:CAMPEP_0114535764 /NCGR_PEP_ID=MMETSP0109-20121206/28610_1 /TAXON_ID=29199 /ORGANISM="Chlorarachnion reptans, Strain CCCM449" /LENGTH=276 /DNA_ID=CAMNT_0001719391 /DNA_START=120 /DNA_END=950 /DNA_ORIENTATION=-
MFPIWIAPYLILLPFAIIENSCCSGANSCSFSCACCDEKSNRNEIYDKRQVRVGAERKSGGIAMFEMEKKKPVASMAYEGKMPTQAFLEKVALVEFNKEAHTVRSAVDKLKNKWLCFMGDIMAANSETGDAFSGCGLPDLMVAQLVKVMVQTESKSKHQHDYYQPSVKFSDETPTKDFLQSVAASNDKLNFSVQPLIASLEAKWITKVKHLKDMLQNDRARGMGILIHPTLSEKLRILFNLPRVVQADLNRQPDVVIGEAIAPPYYAGNGGGLNPV